jgi:hypothetical protein
MVEKRSKFVQRVTHPSPTIHRACTLMDKTPELASQPRRRQKMKPGRRNNESADNLIIVSNNPRNCFAVAIEHERTESRSIGSDPPAGTRAVDLDVHRIVAKRSRKDFEQLTSGGCIGILEHVLYHGSLMNTRFRNPRFFRPQGQTHGESRCPRSLLIPALEAPGQ